MSILSPSSMIWLFLILMLSTVSPCHASIAAEADGNVSNPNPMFEYVLALQWNPTVCNGNPSCSSTSFPNRLTAHGLWPQPEDPCTSGLEFIVEALRDIRGDLDLYWIEAVRGDNVGLWKWEWNGHGRCSNFKNVRTYFQQVLYLVQYRDWSTQITNLFQQGDVNETIVFQTLTANLGVRVGMVCTPNPAGNQKLKEIRLYFRYQQGTGSRGWTLIDYPDTPGFPSPRCSRNRKVNLPPVRGRS